MRIYYYLPETWPSIIFMKDSETCISYASCHSSLKVAEVSDIPTAFTTRRLTLDDIILNFNSPKIITRSQHLLAAFIKDFLQQLAAEK